jgi:hypothetical protein
MTSEALKKSRLTEENMKRKDEKIPECSGQPKIIVRYSEDGGDSHDPPVGIGGDPVYVDPPSDLTPDEGGESFVQSDALAVKTASRYYKYKFARDSKEKPYFNLEKVKILTEKSDATGYINFAEYRVPPDVISSLRLWVERPDGEPTIIIEGKDGGSISTAQKFEIPLTSNPPKRKRPKRYYFPNRRVRIVRWEIVDEKGAALKDPSIENGILAASGADQYYFYISFNHE